MVLVEKWQMGKFVLFDLRFRTWVVAVTFWQLFDIYCGYWIRLCRGYAQFYEKIFTKS